MRFPIVLAAVSLATLCFAQRTAPPTEVAGIPVNYDEAKTGAYTLPAPLVLSNGQRVRDAKTWQDKRRPEIVRLFEDNEYGRAPGRPKNMSFDVFDKGTPAMGGKALRKQITIYFTADKNGPKEDIILYLPPDAKKPVPVLFTINFSPNAGIFDDPGVKLGEMWGRDHKRVPAVRGQGLGRMKIDELLAKGFGVAGLYYGDIEPDFVGGTGLGIRPKDPAPDEWGAISAWAWGMSRAMDYFETDRAVDAKRVAIYGVSRLGKTVMWAGAHDPRFAAVVASCSGEGGAALSRRNYGETIAHLVAPSRYPYQFAGNYAKWAKDPNQAPMDAHMLIALIAPRPLFLNTGSEDGWSDPKGEFLAAVAAEPVYKLLGKTGVGVTEVPAAGAMVGETVVYRMHAGGHGTMPGDWEYILQFLQKNLSQ
jgi:hypothetical protein